MSGLKRNGDDGNVKGYHETGKRPIDRIRAVRNIGGVHLCREHYKEFKKATKEERSLDRLGWE